MYESKEMLVLLLIVLSCIVAFAGCNKNAAVMNRLDMYGVDTQLLDDGKVVCDIVGETFTGRATCYGVISFNSEPTAFLQSFTTDKTGGFSVERNQKFEEKFEQHLSYLDVFDKFLPNWDDEYIWYVSGGINKTYFLDTLFLAYFPNTRQLVVLETGH